MIGAIDVIYLCLYLQREIEQSKALTLHKKIQVIKSVKHKIKSYGWFVLCPFKCKSVPFQVCYCTVTKALTSVLKDLVSKLRCDSPRICQLCARALLNLKKRFEVEKV